MPDNKGRGYRADVTQRIWNMVGEADGLHKAEPEDSGMGMVG